MNSLAVKTNTKQVNGESKMELLELRSKKDLDESSDSLIFFTLVAILLHETFAM